MWLVSVVVRRYIIDILIIIITFPYSTCISSFLAASSLFLCSFFNVFSFFIYMSFILSIIWQISHVQMVEENCFGETKFLGMMLH